MKPVFPAALALGMFLLTPVVLARQQEPRKGAKKIDAKELQRQKMEAFKDAEKARDEYKAWTSQIKWSMSDPFQDRTSYAGGSVKVRKGEDDEKLLFWAVKESTDPQGRNPLNSSRSLYQGAKLLETYEPKKGTNTVTQYNAAALRDFLPQMLVRDGFNRDLEQWFDIEIVANARYMKTEPDEDDWKALGFSGKEEYTEWWKRKKVAKFNPKTGKLEESGNGMTEDRPFSSKEDKFDRNNRRNKPLRGKDGGDYGKYYLIILRPKIPSLQRRLRTIRMTLRPGDFLPINLIFEYSTDRFRNIRFENIQKDPEPEITRDQFTLDTRDYRVIQR